MTVNATVLINPTTLTTSSTLQYSSTNVTTIIDKFTAVNYGAAAAYFTIYLSTATVVGSLTNSELIIVEKYLQPNETYTCPEIVGHAMRNGMSVWAKAGTATSITIRASGRVIT